MKKGIILGIALVFVLSGCSLAGQEGEKDVVKNALSLDSAKAEAEEFINSNLIDPSSGSEAKVTKVEEKDGLYKMSVQVGSQSIDSYMTKDGKTFFPQALDMEEQESGNEDNSNSSQTNPTVSVSQKAKVPGVELFVMSHCPYGTQME